MPKSKPSKFSPYPDIVQDAQTLGVCRTHLYRVLNGKRMSLSLVARYNDLQRLKARSGKTRKA